MSNTPTRVHSDSRRVEQWIETRLWNLKNEGKSKSGRDIIRELSGFFPINLTSYKTRNLLSVIEKLRERVNKRFKRHVRIRSDLAKNWDVDPRLIQRWEHCGLIDLGNHHAVKRLTVLFVEREYTRIIKPEEIPMDPQIKLWD
jgi:hypothetical protein